MSQSEYAPPLVVHAANAAAGAEETGGAIAAGAGAASLSLAASLEALLPFASALGAGAITAGERTAFNSAPASDVSASESED